MKKVLSLLTVGFLLQASAAFADVIQDWTSVQSGMAGTYQDSNGSKIDFTYDAGPKGSDKALKMTCNLVANGYLGVYTGGTWDLSKAASLKFMAKSTIPGDLQIAIKDTYNVQYITKVSIPSTDWSLVTVNLSSFTKDPYYTPPDAIAGHPMDLTKVGNLNFSPQMQGASVVLIGTIETAGTAGAGSTNSTSTAATGSASSSAPAASTASSGTSTPILDCTGITDPKNGGTFQDTMGSTFTFTAKDNPNKKGQQYLAITYELKQGGYCGMWCRAGGADWKGANLTGLKNISLMIYCKDPVVLGLALKDNNNNQYVADTPMTSGGKWETVTVAISDFKLDPYYTPPDAKKGAPQDFSKVATFNIQPKTVGKFTVAVDNMVAK
jgi:hypothetical protein